MRCKVCGYEMPETAKFCKQCGNRVDVSYPDIPVREKKQAADPPPEYVPQMLLQCICTGRKWVDFVDYDPRLLGTDYERLAFWTIRYTPSEEEKATALSAAKSFLADVDQAMKDLLQ